MGKRDIDVLVQEADRLRAEYLDAVNRSDLESALRVGAEELVPCRSGSRRRMRSSTIRSQ
jgi:hypothetical protein